MTRESPSDSAGFCSLGGIGGSCSTLVISSAIVSPVNGGTPVAM